MDKTRPRILAVDDGAEIREFFQFVLESAGYDVEVACDGVEGLERTRTFRPDLIVTDVSMPRMGGLDFLVHLRSDFPPPLPPVVVCSGFDGTAEEALRLGAVRFVAKPVESAALLRIVEQALHGERSDEASLANEREYVRGARARAAAAAARLLAGVDPQAPELVRVFDGLAQWISDYFGYADAGFLLVQGGDLQVAAISRGVDIPTGTTFSGKALYATGLLVAGSSLVLADASALSHFGDAKTAELGIRFLVGVPLLFQQVPIGVLCLVDRVPHSFDAEDLLILEQIGRFIAGGLPNLLLRLTERKLTGLNIRLVPPPVFDVMLAAELSSLHREHGALDLLLVDVDPETLQPDWLSRLPVRPRLGLCRRDANQLAIFKRDSTPASVLAVLSDTLTTLRTVATVRAVGWVSLVDSGLTRVPAQVLLQLTEMALDEARLAPTRPIERIVIQREAALSSEGRSEPPSSPGSPS